MRLQFPVTPHLHRHRGSDLANCTRKRLCNGAYLCADVCVRGTVKADPWATDALSLQRSLQRDEILARNTFIGSHNTAISLAYGYGIESDGIHALLPNSTSKSLGVYHGDDLGEGVGLVHPHRPAQSRAAASGA